MSWLAVETKLRTGASIGFKAGTGEKMGLGAVIKGFHWDKVGVWLRMERGGYSLGRGRGNGDEEGLGSEVGFGMTMASGAVLGEMDVSSRWRWEGCRQDQMGLTFGVQQPR